MVHRVVAFKLSRAKRHLHSLSAVRAHDHVARYFGGDGPGRHGAIRADCCRKSDDCLVVSPLGGAMFPRDLFMKAPFRTTPAFNPGPNGAAIASADYGNGCDEIVVHRILAAAAQQRPRTMGEF